MLSPVDEIKAKIDIVDLIQEYFPLKAGGVNFKACCPFHEEKTPSFMVNREKQFYHCFGCHESGDIFNFIQKIEGVDFPEALKILANKAGVTLPSYDPKMANLKTRVLSVIEEAVEWFHAQLLNSQTGLITLKYFKERRKLTEKTIDEWRLGYALDSWEALSHYLKSKNYSDEEIIQSGLVVPKDGVRRYYDRFRDRAMFPIEDYQGNVVGFTGRAMKVEESAKYVNTPQSLVYNKSEVIFGLYKAKQFVRQQNSVIIVEGNMDVISSYQAGVKNVVAVSGTALTSEQIKILQRLTNNFIFCFDADEAGLRAAERSIILAWQSEINVKVIAIDNKLGKDPDEIIVKDANLWKDLVKKAKSAMDYFFDYYLENNDISDIENKKEVTKNLLNLIIKLVNPIEQDEYIHKLADRINVREESLREVIVNAKRKKKDIYNKARDNDIQDFRKSVTVDRKKIMSERILAIAAYDNEYFDYISQHLDIDFLSDDLKGLYTSLNIYYTKGHKAENKETDIYDYLAKDNGNLLDIVRRLIILKDELAQFKNYEIVEEAKRLITELKKNSIKHRMTIIEKQIKQLENNLKVKSNMEQRVDLEHLVEEYSQLSHQLKDDN